MEGKKPERSELIGKDIRIIKSNNKHQEGLKGKIIDETRETFKVLTKNNKSKKKIIFKRNLLFALDTDERKVNVDGRKIIKKPEDR